MAKMKKVSTPNPGGTPGVTKIKSSVVNWNKVGPGSFGKPGKALGENLFNKQGYTGHGNQRGR